MTVWQPSGNVVVLIGVTLWWPLICNGSEAIHGHSSATQARRVFHHLAHFHVHHLVIVGTVASPGAFKAL